MEFFEIGKIVGTFGIKGELKVKSFTDDLQDFLIDCPYYIGKNKEIVHLDKAKVHKSNVIIKLKNIDNINDVLDYVDSYLYIDMENRNELDEGTYYKDELIGLEVFSNDITIGKLTEIIPTLANDVYVIEGDGKIYQIPAVSEFIKDVNIEDGFMNVIIIEGMANEI